MSSAGDRAAAEGTHRRGPLELYEVLREEFAALELRVPALSGTPDEWSVQERDVLDLERLLARIDDIGLHTKIRGGAGAGFARRVAEAFQRLRPRAARTAGATAGATAAASKVGEATAPSGDDERASLRWAIALLDEAIATTAPARLVEYCRRYVTGDRGAALREHVPDPAALKEETERTRVRRRFNRQVLEVAFGGSLRTVADRELHDLFWPHGAQRETVEPSSPVTPSAGPASGARPGSLPADDEDAAP